MASKILFTIAFFLACVLHSQNENVRWCFGSQAGLNFMNTPPTLQNSMLSGPEGCSSIADAAGNLKMYSNGIDLYNGNNQQMAGMNSGPLIGGGNKQGTLIVKQPGNNPFYYIFVSSYTGLRYSVVDISLAAGMGSVTIKNATLTTTQMAYKCAGTRHCNKIDIWIAAQEQNSGLTYSYLLTASGLGNQVVSSTSMIHNVYACMKFSPDGSKLASTEWGDVRLYDFNSFTGAVTGGTLVTSQGAASWGIEFSPDGSKLYATKSNAYILQWDLNAGPAAAISASQYSVYAVAGPPPNGAGINGALQLGPDGKIYGSRDYGSQMLTVINNPNAAGTACNFNLNGISIAPKHSDYGLPNQVKPAPPLPTISYTLNNCTSVLFAMQSSTVSGINSATPLSVVWNFGDPLSGAANTAMVNGPTHSFSGAGIYTVQVLRNFSCGGTELITQTLSISNSTANLSVTGNMQVCMGESTTLTAIGANSYTWSNNSGSLTSNPMMVISPSVSGVYTVAANVFSTACTATQAVNVNVIPTSTFAVNGNLNICAGESTTLAAFGALTYSWISGAGLIGTNSVQIVTPASSAIYTVMASTNGNTCYSNQFMNVNVDAYPVLSVVTATTICPGQPASFTASGASTYTWVGPGGVMSNSGGITFYPTAAAIYTLIGLDPSGKCESRTTINLSIGGCTGIEENMSDSNPEIFPNPSTGVFMIDCSSECSILVYDLVGRAVLDKTFQKGHSPIDLSLQPDGVYYCKVIMGGTSEMTRLVKVSR